MYDGSHAPSREELLEYGAPTDVTFGAFKWVLNGERAGASQAHDALAEAGTDGKAVAKYACCHVHYRCWVARIDGGIDGPLEDDIGGGGNDDEDDGDEGSEVNEARAARRAKRRAREEADSEHRGVLVHDSWAEGSGPEQFVAHRHRAGSPQHGLGLLIDSMRVGERCVGYVHSIKCYGEKGSFSFPHVPPRAALWYYVELLGADPPPQVDEGDDRTMGGVSRTDMTFEQRVEAADVRRERGNARFKAGDDEGALREYDIALSYLTDDLMFQVEGHHRTYALSVRIPIFSNKAAALLRMCRHDEAIEAASLVLAEDKANAKALFRRGKARLALGRAAEAEEDLNAAAEAAPKDTAIRRALKEVKADGRGVAKAQESAFKGVLGHSDGLGGKDGEVHAENASGEATQSGFSFGNGSGGKGDSTETSRSWSQLFQSWFTRP